MHNYSDILEKTKKSLEQFDANQADLDSTELAQMYSVVFKSGLLEITHLPKLKQEELKQQLFFMLCQISGSLAFLVVQNLAAFTIMDNNNFLKRDNYKQYSCGIAINHLRSPKDEVEAKRVDGGYVVSGELRWVSGDTIFEKLIVGFCFCGSEMEAIVDFKNSDSFKIDKAELTVAGYAMMTQTISLKEYFVPNDTIISSHPRGNYTKAKSASKTVHFCLYALAWRASTELEDLQLKKSIQNRLDELKSSFMNSHDGYTLDNLRIELFSYALDVAKLALTLSGGRALLLSSPIQRVYREILMFNANGLNKNLKDLFLKKFNLDNQIA